MISPKWFGRWCGKHIRDWASLLIAGALVGVFFNATASGQPGAFALPSEEPVGFERILPRLKPRPTDAPKAILFLMEGLTGQDLRQGLALYGPVALWLERKAAGGLVATMGFGGADRYRSLATLSAGMKAFGDGRIGRVLEQDEVWEGTTAFAAYQRSVGMPPFLAPDHLKTLLNPYLPYLSRRNQSFQMKTVPLGLLAGSLSQKGLQVMTIGCQDILDAETGRFVVDRPALLAGLNDIGVGAGFAGRKLLKKDPNYPFGVRADEKRWEASLRTAWDYGDLLVLAPGDDARALACESERLFPLAVTHTFRILGITRQFLRPDRDLLIVVSYAPREGLEGSLLPVWVLGKGFHSGGLLRSLSTHRYGIVTLPDVTATLLHFFGATPSQPIHGTPLLSVPYPKDLNEKRLYLSGLAHSVRLNDGFLRPSVLTVWGWATAFFFLLTAFLIATSGTATDGWLRWLLLLGSFPAATHLSSLLLNFFLITVSFYWLLLAVLPVLMIIAPFFVTSPRLLSLLVIAWCFIWVIDAALRGLLSTDTPFGNSSFLAARFYGLGNAGAGLLVGSLLSAGFLHPSVVASGLLLIVGALLCGLPFFGANVGGALMACSGFVAFVSARKGFKWTLAALLIPIAILSVLVAIEVSRPEPMTHLGRFLRDVFADPGQTIWPMIYRKVSISLRVFRAAHWDAGLLATLTLLLAFWYRLGSDFRLKTLIGLALGGLIFNDTGPQTPFAVLFYPLITLSAMKVVSDAQTKKIS
ncbi:MAG: hypothetical protein NZ959_01435 [Armatimonadetes bacterium]|nr:hypothetical protein [Armatimonadota bacterium]MDW8122090.1 hypothetical protein [Armatimonadota bacterium]